MRQIKEKNKLEINKNSLIDFEEILNDFLPQKRISLEQCDKTIIDGLKLIIDTNFYRMKEGELSVVSCGDFAYDSISQLSLLEYYIVYHTNPEYIDRTCVFRDEKTNKKRMTTYEKITMSSNLNTNSYLQAEDIAKKVAEELKRIISPSQKLYQKRNQMMLKMNDETYAKITVCYDFDDENENYLVRRVSAWNNINLIKLKENIEKKNTETNGQYLRVVRLLKALEIELIAQEISNLHIGRNLFVENFIYNVPNDLFFGEIYEILERIYVFLRLSKFDEYNLIDGTGKMFEYSYNYTKNHAKQFVNKIEYALKNLENLLK